LFQKNPDLQVVAAAQPIVLFLSNTEQTTLQNVSNTVGSQIIIGYAKAISAGFSSAACNERYPRQRP
jgi:hypothetical protein